MDGFGLFGMSGEAIYRNFTEGRGADDLAEAAVLWKTLQDKHVEIAERARAVAVRMESAWQGDAAGAAQRGALPIAIEHEQAAPLLFTSHDLFVVDRSDGRPATAGPDVCTAQMVVEFENDEQARQQQQRLDSVAGVMAVAIQTREQVFQVTKTAYEKGGRPELAKLLRVEAFYPRTWVVFEGNPEQVAMRTRQEFGGGTIHRIWVTNPCTPSTPLPTF